MKKIMILLSLAISSFSINIYGQKTPEELGLLTFDCFHRKNLDSFFALIPSYEEVSAFGETAGIISTTEEHEQFQKKYPVVIDNFKMICKHLLEWDTDIYQFDWTSTELDRIEKSDLYIPFNKADSNKQIKITVIDIYFLSQDKRQFKLTLGDVHLYGELWKPGNNITLSQLKKE